MPWREIDEKWKPQPSAPAEPSVGGRWREVPEEPSLVERARNYLGKRLPTGDEVVQGIERGLGRMGEYIEEDLGPVREGISRGARAVGGDITAAAELPMRGAEGPAPQPELAPFPPVTRIGSKEAEAQNAVRRSSVARDNFYAIQNHERIAQVNRNLGQNSRGYFSTLYPETEQMVPGFTDYFDRTRNWIADKERAAQEWGLYPESREFKEKSQQSAIRGAAEANDGLYTLFLSPILAGAEMADRMNMSGTPLQLLRDQANKHIFGRITAAQKDYAPEGESTTYETALETMVQLPPMILGLMYAGKTLGVDAMVKYAPKLEPILWALRFQAEDAAKRLAKGEGLEEMTRGVYGWFGSGMTGIALDAMKALALPKTLRGALAGMYFGGSARHEGAEWPEALGVALPMTALPILMEGQEPTREQRFGRPRYEELQAEERAAEARQEEIRREAEGIIGEAGEIPGVTAPPREVTFPFMQEDTDAILKSEPLWKSEMREDYEIEINDRIIERPERNTEAGDEVVVESQEGPVRGVISEVWERDPEWEGPGLMLEGSTDVYPLAGPNAFTVLWPDRATAELRARKGEDALLSPDRPLPPVETPPEEPPIEATPTDPTPIEAETPRAAEPEISAPESLGQLQEQMVAASPDAITKVKARALGALVKGVARYRGMEPDEYVQERFQGVVLGGTPAEDSLYARVLRPNKGVVSEQDLAEYVRDVHGDSEGDMYLQEGLAFMRARSKRFPVEGTRKTRQQPIAPNPKTMLSIDVSTNCPFTKMGRPCVYCYVEQPRTAEKLGRRLPLTPKSTLEPVEYTPGTIRDMPQDLVDFLNTKMGGLRMNSSGDWSPEVSDSVAQIISEARTRGLKIKAITKQREFVEKYKRHPSVRINISTDFQPERVSDIFGLELPDARILRETFSNAPTVEEALKWKGKSQRTRIRYTSINPEDTMEALRNPDVDVVTAYHSSVGGDMVRLITEQSPDVAKGLGPEGLRKLTESFKHQDVEAIKKRLSDRDLDLAEKKMCCQGIGQCSRCPVCCGFAEGRKDTLAKLVSGEPVASVEFDANNKALIRALKAPTVSDMAHELAHVFRRDLRPEDIETVRTWAGVKEGEDFSPAAEEKFAGAFERYLAEGKAPNAKLRAVFEKFKQWLAEIYAEARVLPDIEISPELRGVFDKVVAGRKRPGRKPGEKTQAMVRPGQMARPPGAPAVEPGPNYVGYREPGEARPTDEIPPTVIRRGDLFVKLSKDLTMPMDHGRMTREAGQHPDTLGRYVPGTRTLQVKNWGDLQTRAHEVGHALVDRYGEVLDRIIGPNSEFAEELKAIAYTTKLEEPRVIEEGGAEFMRLWMTQRNEAARVAPRTLGAWGEWLNDPKNKKAAAALRAAQSESHGYFEQSPLGQLRAMIGGADTPTGQLGVRMRDWFREKVADEFHGMLRAARMTGDETLDAWKWARRARGIPEAVYGLWEKGVPRMTDVAAGDMEWSGKGLRHILDPIHRAGELENFVLWSLAEQLKPLYKLGKAGGVTEPMIEAGLGRKNAKNAESFETAARELEDFNQRVAQFMIQSGTLNQQQMEGWNRGGIYLYALNRIKATEARAGGAESALTSEQGIRRMLGTSHRQFRDPLISMVEGPSRLITLAMENQVRQRIAKIAYQQNGGLLMEPVPAQAKYKKVNVERILDDLTAEAKDLGIDIEQVADAIKNIDGMPDVITQFYGQERPPGSRVMTVLYGGKPRYYEIKDDMLLRSIEAMKPKEAEKFVRLLNMYRRFRQQTVTLDPRFIIGNFLRDPLMASIMTRTGFQHFTATLRGMRAAWTHNDTYWDAVLHGGLGRATLRDDGLVNFRAQILPRVEQSGFKGENLIVTPADVTRALGRIVAQPFRALEYAGRSVELAPRIGEYIRATEKGMSKTEAAHMAREVTVDFAARGAGGTAQFLANTLPFFNAMIQGADRLYRGVAVDQGHRVYTAGRMAMVPMMSAALQLLNMTNEDYNKLPSWDKRHYWHFFIGGEHFKMPKIWEVGSLASVMERFMEQLYQSDDPANRQLWRDLAKTVLDNFSISFGPLEPIIEQATNRVMFTGAPIETSGMKHLEPWMRYRSGAGPAMRAFGKVQQGADVQVSPARAEALLRGLIGYWTVYGLKVADSFFEHAPEQRLDEWLPGWGKIYEHKGKYSKWGTEWYDVFKELDQASTTYNRMMMQGDRDAIGNLTPEDRRRIGIAGHARRVQKKISHLNGLIRDLPSRQGMTGHEKMLEKERLKKERDRVMENAVRFLRGRMKE